ncbi:hypothetical protein ABC970_20250 [Bacillus licheniformis]|uniref:hypothetical protein n=1 Tax=Bacillus TaxID=1386 RepID=UPI000A8B974B|nr:MULTISPECIES: hypothetical protein [Bacillus]MDE1397172.1 hypothetical protein [Bacillus licheniformis]PAC96996.1 hypothetical protein CHH89_19900 [Bacillus licheniformis]PAE47508.1 hypothetical protein CHH94_09345 [Bacillus licheniformis]TWN77133.1 hypothetical protein CHCC20494_1196 [Bacillus licheniformis]
MNIAELERRLGVIKTDDPFEASANNLIISIGSYCSEKNIALKHDNGQLKTDRIKELIKKSPDIFDKLEESSETKRYFKHHFGSVVKNVPLSESIKMTALVTLDKLNHYENFVEEYRKYVKKQVNHTLGLYGKFNPRISTTDKIDLDAIIQFDQQNTAQTSLEARQVAVMREFLDARDRLKLLKDPDVYQAFTNVYQYVHPMRISPDQFLENDYLKIGSYNVESYTKKQSKNLQKNRDLER